MSEQRKDDGPSKRDSSGRFKNNEEQITAWLEELEEENEFSDFDDSVEDPNYIEEQECQAVREDLEEDKTQSSESEYDTDDNEPLSSLVSQTNDNTSSHYIGKNGFSWSKTEVARNSRTPAHNIIHVSQPKQALVFRNFEELWSKMFDSEMLATITLHTNNKLQTYRERFRDSSRQELKDTNESEMRCLFGLLYYSSVFKNNDTDANYLFATNGTGHEIFRCVMSKYRFCTLLNCLRFDDGTDRQERLKSDKLAAISWLFDKFVLNSQQNYNLGPNTCIDEMLIPFRGRCKFVVYMPNKPAKYGIKVLVLSDAETRYMYNAYIYCGKGSDGEGLSPAEKDLAVPTQSVLKLSKPIENSNRNITADNWFSSIPLMQILTTKKLTYLGTLKKNKKEIPPEFLPNKHREPGSSLYGFTKDYTLLSHVPKKCKAVVLISSSHHTEAVDDKTKKPIMIVDYNHSKGGVDEIDKKCSIYSSSRKTRRWPMAIFYRILDLAGTNAFVLYESCPGAKLRRGDFILSLARELVLPILKERVYNNRLPRELRLTIARVLGKDLPPPQPQFQPPGPAGRKLCSICPSKLKRQTRYNCFSCKKPICLQCSSPTCKDCQN